MKPVEDKIAAPMKVVAVLSDVTVTFDSYLTRALSNVNLEVRRGEILGLLGPKGSGKSTVLRLLAGRLRPADGKIRVLGGPPWRWRIRRRLGYIPPAGDEGFASAGFFGWIRKIFGVRKPATSAARRRGADLAQALAASPEIIIFDDAFAGLAPAEAAEMKHWLASLARQGKTIVVSSDSLPEASAVCGRIAVLFAGRVQAAGTSDELLAHPDAIRFLAPVLPHPTARRILDVIREDIARENTGESSSATSPGTAPSTDKILAPLANGGRQKQTPESPPASSSDGVKHELLHELTRPAPAVSPPLEKPKDP